MCRTEILSVLPQNRHSGTLLFHIFYNRAIIYESLIESSRVNSFQTLERVCSYAEKIRRTPAGLRMNSISAAMLIISSGAKLKPSAAA
jgi:hypothetical protein